MLVHGGHPATILVVLAMAAVLVACARPGERSDAPGGPEKSTPNDGPPELAGTEWVLASLDGREPAGEESITLAFYDGRYLEGEAGCNSYGARYAARGEGFRLREALNQTDFDCDAPRDVREQETAYFDTLRKAATLRVARDRLEIGTAEGEGSLVFIPQERPSIDPALEGSGWVLTSLKGRDLLKGTRITLEFDNGSAGGHAGCNSYGGEYAAADDGVFEMSTVESTLVGCREDIARQEDAYLDALTDAAAYQLQGGRLKLQDAASETILVYKKES